MAEEEGIRKKQTSKSLQSAMRKLNKGEEYYARLIIQFSNKTRLKVYRKIASLMRNRFSLIGVYMVPPMIDAAPNVVWRGLAKDLVDLSGWIKDNWLIAFSSLPVIMLTIYFTISIWTGRIRAAFDAIPPWSLYKSFVGISWLLAMAALVKGGTPVSTAMRALRRDATRYLRERIDKTLVFINNGDNLGQALAKTKLNFPDKELIDDLKIYSELDNFEEALDNLANEWLEESVYSIEEKAGLLNMVALLSIGAVIAWAVMGTFDMQDQITSSMGTLKPTGMTDNETGVFGN